LNVAGAIALICGPLINVVLVRLLNPVFDPHWRKRDVPYDALRDRFFRAMVYAWAVVKKQQDETPEGKPYDYRSRVGTGTAVLCWLYWIILFTFGVVAVVLTVAHLFS
jgi:hypothetical protein